MKYTGNIVIKRDHLKRLVLDKKAQAFFDQMKDKILKNEFTNEQAMRKVAVEDKNQEYIEKLKTEGMERVKETMAYLGQKSNDEEAKK